MTKYLTLIRHAKSDRSDPSLGDHDRPLNKRGRQDGPIMAPPLGLLPVPDSVLASTAVRVQQTLATLNYPFSDRHPQVTNNAQLYIAEPEDIWDIVYSELSVVGDVWVVAHNPGITELACLLAELELDNVPTLGVVRFGFEDLPTQPVGGRLLYFDCPKNHK